MVCKAENILQITGYRLQNWGFNWWICAYVLLWQYDLVRSSCNVLMWCCDSVLTQCDLCSEIMLFMLWHWLFCSVLSKDIIISGHSMHSIMSAYIVSNEQSIDAYFCVAANKNPRMLTWAYASCKLLHVWSNRNCFSSADLSIHFLTLTMTLTFT